MLRLNLDQNGYITELGYSDYAYPAPSFIGFNTNMRCVNVADINNPDSWVLPPKSLQQITDADEIFCKQFTKELIIRIRQENLTNNQRLNLLNIIKDAMNSLQYSDAEVSRAVFNAIAVTGLWTQARKDWVLLQIDNHLST